MTIDRDDILRLTKAVEEATQVGHVLWQTLEDLRTDLVHELRKLLDAENDKEGPVCRCDLCDTDVPVLEAQIKGWSGVGKWKNGETAFLGICPSCIETARETKSIPEKPLQTPSSPKKGPRTSLFPDEQ